MIQKFALFLLIVFVTSACGTRPAEVSSEVTDWMFPASDVKSINLTNEAGDIVVRQTTGSNILITVTKSARRPDDLKGVNVEFQQVADSVSGTVNYLPGSWSVSVVFEIQVPPNLSIQIESASGNITIENYQGTLNLSTASGALTLHNVSGEIQADTSSGNIEARDVDGNVNVSSASGDMVVSYGVAPELTNNSVLLTDVLDMWTYRVEPDGTQNSFSPPLPGTGQRIFENSSGTITLQLPHELAVDVFAQLFSGNFESEFDQMQSSADKVRYTGHINGGGPLIILTNASGAIDVEELPIP
jgi:Putative adhesin